MSGGWQIFWLVVITLAIVSYFGLSIVIAIGGAFDVRKMFQRLSAARELDQRSTSPVEGAGESNEMNDSVG